MEREEVRNDLPNDLTEIWARVAAIPQATPRFEVRRHFDLMAEAYRQGLSQSTRKPWWQHAVAQFTFGFGLLAVGLFVGHRNSEIAELRDELHEMRQMITLSLLQQQSASDRLKGVSWSYQLQQPGSEVLAALLDTLMHDSNVNVRLAAIDALRQSGGQQFVRNGVLEALRRQDSPMVQMALIDLVVDWRDSASVKTLRDLIQNQKLDEAVRERAQDGLTRLQ